MTPARLAPDRSRARHCEVQSLTWKPLAATVAAVGLAVAVDALVAGVVVLFLAVQLGWRRRRLVVDDRYLWAGRSGLALADVVEVRRCDGKQLRDAGHEAHHHALAPGPSNDKTWWWMPRGVLVATRTPEGVELTWAVSSHDPDRLAEAVRAGAQRASREAEPAVVDTGAGPQPTPALRRRLDVAGETADRQRVPAPAWVWAATVGVLAAILASDYARHPAGGFQDDTVVPLVLGVGTLALIGYVSARRVVVDERLRCGKTVVSLADVCSARIAWRPELLTLRQRLSRAGRVRAPLWAPAAVVLRLRDDPRGVEQPDAAASRTVLIGAAEPERLLAAIAQAVTVTPR